MKYFAPDWTVKQNYTRTLLHSITINNINNWDSKPTEKNHFSLYYFCTSIWNTNFPLQFRCLINTVQLRILGLRNTIDQKRMFGILYGLNNAHSSMMKTMLDNLNRCLEEKQFFTTFYRIWTNCSSKRPRTWGKNAVIRLSDEKFLLPSIKSVHT